MSAWTARRAELGDAAGIARVSVAAWRAAYAGLMGAERLAALSLEERVGRWRARLGGQEPNSATTLVIEQIGAIAGFVSVGAQRDVAEAAASPRTGELWAIYVDPMLWGKGAGQALLAAARAELRAAGYDDFVLWVLRDNARARRFYEAAGLRFDGAEKTPLDESGERLPHVRYRGPT
jgi:ribosomal protein S18 acetylase RimI-like enzyme